MDPNFTNGDEAPPVAVILVRLHASKVNIVILTLEAAVLWSVWAVANMKDFCQPTWIKPRMPSAVTYFLFPWLDVKRETPIAG